MSIFIEMQGRRYGRLLVTGPAEKRTFGYYWRCRCDCGKVTWIIGTTLRNGRSRSCGCGKGMVPGTRTVRALPTEESTRRRVHRSIRKSATVRGLAFELTAAQLDALIQQDCHYCGCPPSNRIAALASHADGGAPFFYSGLDRVDSQLGYSLSNVVPCCIGCNKLKGRSSVEDFLARITNLYTYAQAILERARKTPLPER
jgi:hypothetical protein